MLRSAKTGHRIGSKPSTVVELEGDGRVSSSSADMIVRLLDDRHPHGLEVALQIEDNDQEESTKKSFLMLDSQMSLQRVLEGSTRA